MEYRYLSHTAEAKFQAFGQTLEDVFSNAGMAMTNLMVENPVPVEKREVEVTGNSVESLLYDFLNELLYLKDTGYVAGDFRDLTISKQKGTYKLESEVWVDKVEHYEAMTDVKAPTYHEMKVEKEENDWVAQVVVDV